MRVEGNGQGEVTVLEASDEISADEIDGSFLPRLRPQVAGVQIDGESVLLLEGTERVHWLDQLGTIVLGCFDGSATLDDLVADISDVFNADPEVVGNDVLALVRQLGRVGLLEGVAEEVIEPPERFTPQSLEIGAELPAFSFPELTGGRLGLEDFRDQRLLMVNWSPHCGYCARIAPELEELRPELERHGVRLVLLSVGSAEANQGFLEEHGLECTVLLQEPEAVEFFAGIGTPSAYLVDESGRTASELAVGAFNVPDLARSAAGVEQ